jgi:hypothetical protein
MTAVQSVTANFAQRPTATPTPTPTITPTVTKTSTKTSTPTIMLDVKKGFFGTAALQTSDFQTKSSKTYGPFTPALSSGWYSIDLTGGKDYINNLSTLSGLTQIRLRFNVDDNNNAIANYLSLYSGNAPAASRPQLIIEYSMP